MENQAGIQIDGNLVPGILGTCFTAESYLKVGITLSIDLWRNPALAFEDFDDTDQLRMAERVLIAQLFLRSSSSEILEESSSVDLLPFSFGHGGTSNRGDLDESIHMIRPSVTMFKPAFVHPVIRCLAMDLEKSTIPCYEYRLHGLAKLARI
jgi:hypothetical protein